MYAALILVAAIALMFVFSGTGNAAVTPDTGIALQDTYGYSELIYLASQAGFGPDSSTAAAIALAESSGNRWAVGDVDLGRSIGLWQINLASHPEYTEQELYDPFNNANAAYNIAHTGRGFENWTTYRNGAYLNYLQA